MGGCATVDYKTQPQAKPNQQKNQNKNQINNKVGYQRGNLRANAGGEGMRRFVGGDEDIPMKLKLNSNKPIKRRRVPK